jgi:REP element-mobilizing transposase RayT
MGKTYISCLLHVVFGTAEQKNLLSAEIRSKLAPYLAAVARSKGIKMVSMGGTENHIHLLIAIPARLAVESAILPLKQGSETWLKQQFTELAGFRWQKGYAAFSISRSQLDHTLNYIQYQEKFHWKKSFEEEYAEFLDWHHMPYNKEVLLK